MTTVTQRFSGAAEQGQTDRFDLDVLTGGRYFGANYWASHYWGARHFGNDPVDPLSGTVTQRFSGATAGTVTQRF